MKVSREEAARNRALIVEAAGRLFREKGLDGISVVEIMKAVDLSHGGFYGHFKSKIDLAEEACERGLSRGAAFWNRLADESKNPLYDLVDSYLSADHLKSPGKGCFFAALCCDVSRQGRGLRRVFTAGLRASIDAMVRVVSERAAASRRQSALAIISQLVGAMVLARSVEDDALSREILAANEADILGRRR